MGPGGRSAALPNARRRLFVSDEDSSSSSAGSRPLTRNLHHQSFSRETLGPGIHRTAPAKPSSARTRSSTMNASCWRLGSHPVKLSLSTLGDMIMLLRIASRWMLGLQRVTSSTSVSDHGLMSQRSYTLNLLPSCLLEAHLYMSDPIPAPVVITLWACSLMIFTIANQWCEAGWVHSQYERSHNIPSYSLAQVMTTGACIWAYSSASIMTCTFNSMILSEASIAPNMSRQNIRCCSDSSSTSTRSQVRRRVLKFIYSTISNLFPQQSDKFHIGLELDSQR